MARANDTDIIDPPEASTQQDESTDIPGNGYAESGVDITLIHWFLALSPLERLQTVQNYIASIEKIRHANPRP